MTSSKGTAESTPDERAPVEPFPQSGKFRIASPNFGFEYLLHEMYERPQAIHRCRAWHRTAGIDPLSMERLSHMLRMERLNRG